MWFLIDKGVLAEYITMFMMMNPSMSHAGKLDLTVLLLTVCAG